LKLVVTEKNIAAKKLAEILAVGKPTTDKVYSTPIYRFRRDGEDWISIGLKGHILGVDFPLQLVHNGGWSAVWEEGEPTPAEIPDSLATPPWPKRKPFTRTASTSRRGSSPRFRTWCGRRSARRLPSATHPFAQEARQRGGRDRDRDRLRPRGRADRQRCGRLLCGR
jgi:hypothetical protein